MRADLFVRACMLARGDGWLLWRLSRCFRGMGYLGFDCSVQLLCSLRSEGTTLPRWRLPRPGCSHWGSPSRPRPRSRRLDTWLPVLLTHSQRNVLPRSLPDSPLPSLSLGASLGWDERRWLPERISVGTRERESSKKGTRGAYQLSSRAGERGSQGRARTTPLALLDLRPFLLLLATLAQDFQDSRKLAL